LVSSSRPESTTRDTGVTQDRSALLDAAARVLRERLIGD